MSSGAYDQLSGRGLKKRPLLGQDSPSLRSLLTSLLLLLLRNRNSNPTKIILALLRTRGRGSQVC